MRRDEFGHADVGRIFDESAHRQSRGRVGVVDWRAAGIGIAAANRHGAFERECVSVFEGHDHGNRLHYRPRLISLQGIVHGLDIIAVFVAVEIRYGLYGAGAHFHHYCRAPVGLSLPKHGLQFGLDDILNVDVDGGAYRRAVLSRFVDPRCHFLCHQRISCRAGASGEDGVEGVFNAGISAQLVGEVAERVFGIVVHLVGHEHIVAASDASLGHVAVGHHARFLCLVVEAVGIFRTVAFKEREPADALIVDESGLAQQHMVGLAFLWLHGERLGQIIFPCLGVAGGIVASERVGQRVDGGHKGRVAPRRRTVVEIYGILREVCGQHGAVVGEYFAAYWLHDKYLRQH